MSRYTPAKPWDNTPGYRNQSRQDAVFGTAQHPGKGTIRLFLSCVALMLCACFILAMV